MSHRILIADDHPLMRTALTQTIGQAIPGAVILEASRFEQIKPLLDTGSRRTSSCSTCTCPA
ncbi:hypothetical protein [Azospirillum sp. INR13]|uniref:hypothetical protein n=1 Tax=Azospirillum sp. INR13 TaxID=2596919 RepID=UPI002104CD21|nr:hypothetical protein [Azospirillum sp. INR13]